MPVDSDGNRADIVMDLNARINRMNLGGLYEVYINAARRDLRKNIGKRLNIALGDKHAHTLVDSIYHENNALFNETYSHLMGFYKMISPLQYKWMAEEAPDVEKVNHLASVIKKNLYLYLPTNNTVEYLSFVKEIEKTTYAPIYGKLTYRTKTGEVVTSNDPGRIGPMYTILLEKTGDDWSAIASGKVQNQGFLSRLTRNDKFASPTRNQPVRAFGESEFRILNAYGGARLVAELKDRNNNPTVHKEIVTNILDSPTPTAIDCVVDRDETPFGQSKDLQLVNHMLFCSGIELKYTKTTSPDFKGGY